MLFPPRTLGSPRAQQVQLFLLFGALFCVVTASYSFRAFKPVYEYPIASTCTVTALDSTARTLSETYDLLADSRYPELTVTRCEGKLCNFQSVKCVLPAARGASAR